MQRVRKLIVLYFAAAGIAAHLLVLGVWIKQPHMIWRAEERLTAWLRSHGLRADAAPAAGDPAAVLQQAFPPWKPNPTANLAEHEIRVSGIPAEDLATAAGRLRDGDTLEIGPGTYRQGLEIHSDGVTVRGQGHVVFDRASVRGKGTLVIRGDDTTIMNIECRNVSVRDGNGACVRLAGRNLTLDHVYFHRSQEGVLTGREPGQVTVNNSRFELLGKGGRAHGLYIGGGELIIRNSLILSSINQGHELKSRARFNLIEQSVIASLSGNDSRLIDISNGGQLIIRGSVLEEGPASVNSDVIGFALEGTRYPHQDIELSNNIILLEGRKHGELLHQRPGTPKPQLNGNAIISSREPTHAGMNIWLKTRKEAGLGPYPALPQLPQQDR